MIKFPHMFGDNDSNHHAVLLSSQRNLFSHVVRFDTRRHFSDTKYCSMTVTVKSLAGEYKYPGMFKIYTLKRLLFVCNR